MKIFITILGLFSFTLVYSQNRCGAIIDWQYLKTIDIYESPDGKVIHQMKNDSTNEDFLHLEIIDQTDSYFYISIGIAIKTDDTTGWIRKAAYIGAYKRHEKFPMDLILYNDTRISDSGKIVIANWQSGLLTIENCQNKWAYVSVRQNGRTFKGWIETNELCANAYTTCN